MHIYSHHRNSSDEDKDDFTNAMQASGCYREKSKP